MRIGICLNMLTDQPGGTGVEFIEKAARIGFDYAELPLAETMNLPEKDFDALTERVERSGIHCECMNNFFPGTFRLTGPQADRTAIAEYIRASLFRAGRLGARIVVFGSGPAKTVPHGFSPEAGYRQVLEITRVAADVAARYGIFIVIEPLRRQECNLINSYEEGVRLARETDRANARVLVDYYHLSEEGEPTGHIAQDGGWLEHVHFARHSGRSFPQNAREEPGYGIFSDALASIGYQGRISLEAYTQDFDREAPAALREMRALFGR